MKLEPVGEEPKAIQEWSCNLRTGVEAPLIFGNKLECYDIGEIIENDLDLLNQQGGKER